jgi:hypothetical protein
MDNQKINILVKEYKELRDIAEAYQKLLGKYQLLSYVYQ